MATPNAEVSNSTTFFHQRVFGQNIEIDNSAIKAKRHTSFDNGITFTNKQIKANEYICMKIVEVDESGQWLGSLAIGFIQNDPGQISRNELCKSAIPNVCSKSSVSYVKRVFDKLTRNTVIRFYYNEKGVFYILDGKEQEIARGINPRCPMWGVIDLYGNVKAATLVGLPNVDQDSKAFFIRYNQAPDKLPIKYFRQLNSSNLQKIMFHEVHGLEIDLYCHNTIVFRKNVQVLNKPYIFVDFPMRPGDELYIRILSVDFNYRLAGVVGFTNVKLPDFLKNTSQLPANDPTALYDRSEFWIINNDVFSETLSELDEYRFTYTKNGDITLLRNNAPQKSATTVACADPTQGFYPFFFLNGRIIAFSIMGLVSEARALQPAPAPPKADDDDSDSCQICYDKPANCVMIPCGHVFFCSSCKSKYEESRSKNCPICRKVYEQIFEIAND